jgi:UrcA family protein
MPRTFAPVPTRILFVVATALCSTSLVHAVTPPRTLETPPVKVSFSDLNLDTPAGAKVLYGRISRAAAQVCGPGLATWYPGKARAVRDCLNATVDRAVKQINRPTLTAMHEHVVSLASR